MQEMDKIIASLPHDELAALANDQWKECDQLRDEIKRLRALVEAGYREGCTTTWIGWAGFPGQMPEDDLREAWTNSQTRKQLEAKP